MNKRTEVSKNKDKRSEETEKMIAETERSIAVAMTKRAHKLIEDAEKSRKRSSILSIRNRLAAHLGLVLAFRESIIIDIEMQKLAPGQRTTPDLRNVVKMYESIRFDLQKTLSIKDEDFEKLFPKIEINLGSYKLASSSLDNMAVQMRDMKIYCERMLH